MSAPAAMRSRAETREDAARYLTRTGNGDLLEVLGLKEPRSLLVDGRPVCPVCMKPLPVDGRKACRRKDCAVGPVARGVKR